MKHLLSILCLFVLSCDSDGDNDISLSDLNGEWWTEHCEEYTGGCDSNEVGIEDCENSEYFYVVINNGTIQDCRTDNIPECNPYETSTITLNGNSMIVCSEHYVDDECMEGIISVNDDSFQWIVINEIYDNCIRTTINNAQRKN